MKNICLHGLNKQAAPMELKTFLQFISTNSMLLRSKMQRYIYVDDITVFENDKKILWEVKQGMEKFLEKDRLKLHSEKTYIAPVSIGIDHLGYRIFPTHRLLSATVMPQRSRCKRW